MGDDERGKITGAIKGDTWRLDSLAHVGDGRKLGSHGSVLICATLY